MTHTMPGTLLSLHLRSHRAGWVTLLALAAAVLRRILGPWTSGSGPFDTMLSLMFVAAAGTLITAGMATPFGDAERSASGLLPLLRLSQLAGTSLVAAVGFALAAGTGGLSTAGNLRDLGGFIGIALLTGVAVGAGRCWVAPLGYVVLCAGEVDLGQHALWAWPTLPITDPQATIVAGILLILGAVVVSAGGLPDR
jgi:hypothetical protein